MEITYPFEDESLRGVVSDSPEHVQGRVEILMNILKMLMQLCF